MEEILNSWSASSIATVKSLIPLERSRLGTFEKRLLPIEFRPAEQQSQQHDTGHRVKHYSRNDCLDRRHPRPTLSPAFFAANIMRLSNTRRFFSPEYGRPTGYPQLAARVAAPERIRGRGGVAGRDGKPLVHER